jgi:alpha-glucosidase
MVETREGILGNEYNRWSSRVTPEHKATLPFTRLVAGPADFTPGGFLNKPLDQSQFNVRPSQVQGTRCAELAFVCLESPIINAADHPSHYRDEPGLDFLKVVPTVWDDTRVLDGAVGEHLVAEQQIVTAADGLTLHLARAGGAVASFEPASPATPQK